VGVVVVVVVVHVKWHNIWETLLYGHLARIIQKVHKFAGNAQCGDFAVLPLL
jgi:hypothetical protein